MNDTITLALSVDIDDLVEQLDDPTDALAIIKALDESADNWDFTARAYLHFKDLLKNRQEQYGKTSHKGFMREMRRKHDDQTRI